MKSFYNDNNANQDEWRNYMVGDSIHSAHWMNDEDSMMAACLFERAILSISAKHPNKKEGIHGRLCVPTNSSLHEKIIITRNFVFDRFYRVVINNHFELRYFETHPAYSPQVNFPVEEFELQNKGCIIKHEGLHCESIIANESRASILQCPCSISFNRWLLSIRKKLTCFICNKCDNDGFIQCDLCKSWIHKICMTNIHDPSSFKGEKTTILFCANCASTT